MQKEHISQFITETFQQHEVNGTRKIGELEYRFFRDQGTGTGHFQENWTNSGGTSTAKDCLKQKEDK